MAKLGINTGTTANDGTGDSLRIAGGKINTNFDEIYSAFGDGTNLSAGIVTNITAGNFISISTSFGDVTITGLANTENITSQSLIVSGISTLGIVTGATSLSVGPIYADSLTATGSIVANNFVGDGSQITGLATTETVHAERLLVTGITTLGVVTDTTSIQATDLYATNITGDGTGITFVPYAGLAGVATYASNSGIATYAPNAGVATYAPNAGVATYAPTAGFATDSTLATHATTAGVSSYTSSWTVGEDPTNNTHYRFTGPGVSTDQDDPELYLVRGGVYRFTNQLGRHPLQIQTTPNGTVGTPYTDGITNSATINGDMIWNVQFDAPNQLYYQCQTHTDMGGAIEILNNDTDFAGYSDVAGIATYATNAGVATYAPNAGLSTNSNFSGYSDVAGIATYATNAGVATYAPNAGLSTNSTYSGYSDVAGIATYATNAGVATYSPLSGVSTYSSNSGIATYATNAGVATYAPNAGLSTNSTYAGYATTAGIATVATNAQGLTGTPDITVDSVTAGELIVSGVTTLGVVTGATYYGDGTNLTGVVLENTTQSFNQLVVSGMSTIGFLTGAQAISGNTIYATSFVGDGSQVTGVTAEGSIGFALDDTYVGAGFTQLDFVYEGSVSGSFVAIGDTGRITVTGVANTAQTKSESLVVTGISTLGVITGATSLEVGQIYGTNFTGNSGSADQVKTQTQSLDVNYNVTFVEGDNGSPTNETVYTEGSLTYNTFSQILSSPNVSVSSSVTAANFYGSLTGTASNSTLVSGTTTSFLLDYNNFTNTPTVPTNNNQLTNGAGYITTSFTNTNQLTNGAGFVTSTGDGSGLVDGRWTLGANGTDDYTFTGIGFTQTTNDPDLYLARGRVYEFVNEMGSHPFQIQDTQNGSVGNPYNNGVTNNGASNGTVKFEVPFNAPDTLYYQCESHTGMGGTIFIYPTLR